MAHKALIEGTSYGVSGGKTLVEGTAYSITEGKTLVDGTGYSITVAVESDCTITISGGSKGGGTTQNNCYDAYVTYNGGRYINTSIIVQAGESIEITLTAGEFSGTANTLFRVSPRVVYEYTKLDGTQESYDSGYKYSWVKQLTIEADTTITFSMSTSLA